MIAGRNRLVVFLKAPRPGTVKTRLAQTLGAAAACLGYRQLLATLLHNLAPLDEVELRFAPADARAEITPWLRSNWSACPQATGDLGDRLHAAFAEHFDQTTARVIIIGSDCPEVMPADIAAAWSALHDHDLVLGPATDGGYWLIGLRAPQPSLFAAMPWSTPTLLTETLQRAKEHGLSVVLLRELADVDTQADWERWLQKSRLQVDN